MTDTITRVGELYQGFINASTEIQVVSVIGMLVCAAAAKNVWSILHPIRFGVAYTLRIVAWVFCPRKEGQVTPSSRNERKAWIEKEREYIRRNDSLAEENRSQEFKLRTRQDDINLVASQNGELQETITKLQKELEEKNMEVI